eukprot:270503-Chlamydomonas_euryale.AAC.1
MRGCGAGRKETAPYRPEGRGHVACGVFGPRLPASTAAAAYSLVPRIYVTTCTLLRGSATTACAMR